MDTVVVGEDSARKLLVPDFDLTPFNEESKDSCDEVDDYNCATIDSLIKTYLIPNETQPLVQEDIVMNSMVHSTILENCANEMNNDKITECKSTNDMSTEILQGDVISKSSNEEQQDLFSDPKVLSSMGGATNFVKNEVRGQNFMLSYPKVDLPPSISKNNNVFVFFAYLPNTVAGPNSPAAIDIQPQSTEKLPSTDLFGNVKGGHLQYPNVNGNHLQYPINVNGVQLQYPVSFGDEIDDPVYVNPKQYHRILKRRLVRQRLVTSGRIPFGNSRVRYLHESRHIHALKRQRGESGRFLNMEDKGKAISNPSRKVKEN